MSKTSTAALLMAGVSMAALGYGCSSGSPNPTAAANVSDTKTTETKTTVTKTTETKNSAAASLDTRSTDPKRADTGTTSRRVAETVAKTIKWENEKWIPLNLVSEGIELKEVRFEVEGGVNFNPLRAGKGPQAFMPVKNTTDHKMKLAVAIALFDGRGTLVGASEITYGGSIDPGETGEFKLTFRDVKWWFFDVNTAQIALETYK